MIWESNLLLKFILNKCTDVEEQTVLSWLSESKQNENTLTYLRLNMQPVDNH
jgi:hypothetical protein